MSNATHSVDLIKLSLVSGPSGDRLVGTSHPAQNPYYGDREPLSYYLGESCPFRPGAPLTGALRDFSLTTARAPGDWPSGSVNDAGPVRF